MRVLVINDLSCEGRCSLTVALPILCAFGLHTNCLPTAVLSTQTGGINDFTYKDLTRDMVDILNHHKKLNIDYPAIYSGYLGSKQQIDIVNDVVNNFNNKLFLLDPVMGDNGQLYVNFDMEYVEKMKILCNKANIIVPNVTEACLLTDIDFSYDIDYYMLIDKLKLINKGIIVVTGIVKDNKLGCIAYDPKTNDYIECFRNKIEGMYHGTGDIFASCLFGSLCSKKSLKFACELAVDVVTKSIEITKKKDLDTRFGVEFEDQIKFIIDKIKAD